LRLIPVVDGWLGYSVRRSSLDKHLEELRDHMTGRVLEVGNGRRRRRGRFRPPDTESWTFADIDQARDPHIVTNIEQLPWPDMSFDSVVCLETLEYVDDPLRALKEISRVLDGAGVLVLSVPFLHRCDGPHDYWRCTKPGLQEVLRRAGFRVEIVFAQGGGLVVLTNILKQAIHNMPEGRARQLLAIVARPLLNALCRVDEAACKKLPVLSTFSTGYLVAARPAWEDNSAMPPENP